MRKKNAGCASWPPVGTDQLTGFFMQRSLYVVGMAGGWKRLPKSWAVAHKRCVVDSTVSRQKGSKGWGTGRSHMRGFAQLMMRKTEMVGTSDQIHPRLKRSQATGSMAGLARQAGQPFPEGSIQALDKSGVEDRATLREQKQFLCLGQQAMGHPSGDLDDPLVLGPLDHRANGQLCQTCKHARPTPLVCLTFSRNAR